VAETTHHVIAVEVLAQEYEGAAGTHSSWPFLQVAYNYRPGAKRYELLSQIWIGPNKPQIELLGITLLQRGGLMDTSPDHLRTIVRQYLRLPEGFAYFCHHAEGHNEDELELLE